METLELLDTNSNKMLKKYYLEFLTAQFRASYNLFL